MSYNPIEKTNLYSFPFGPDITQLGWNTKRFPSHASKLQLPAPSDFLETQKILRRLKQFEEGYFIYLFSTFQ